MYYTHLNLKCNPLKDDFKFPAIESATDSPFQYRPKDWIKDNGDNHWSIWKYSFDDILSSQFLAWVDQMNLVPAHTLLFHAPPNSKLVPHLDGGGSEAWAFNWAIGNGIKMSWYETTTTPAKERAYRSEELVQEYSNTLLGYPTLVKIGVPHGACNDSSESAWILSLRFKNSLPYQQVKQMFLKLL